MNFQKKYDVLSKNSEKIKNEMIDLENISKQRLTAINDLSDKVSQLEDALKEANRASKKEDSKTGFYRVIRSNNTYTKKD